ncbi:hypothetical protein AVEN_61593-1 [Araneus ventricosus]|uniref:Uncharacterized protein n=1 Tax=Araneus ventricosus TaxID=182803 RepID=A0A4Y2NLM4_ARAVE|nr:hypothetical protein AVEN_61593-1 [Araneus ventricosus]
MCASKWELIGQLRSETLTLSVLKRGGTHPPPPGGVSITVSPVRYITETIIWAADAAIPKSSPNPHKLRKPWWNDACRDAVRRQKRLWGIFRRCPTTENLIDFMQNATKCPFP